MGAYENVTISIYENGSMLNYFDEYYVSVVDGKFNITNPSDDTTLYGITIPLDLGGVDIIDLSGDGYVNPTYWWHKQAIEIRELLPGATLEFEYMIRGITPTVPTLDGKTFVESGMIRETPKIYADMLGDLKKAGIGVDPDGNLQRAIYVHVENPTDFRYKMDTVKVMKSSDLDPNNELNEWGVFNDSLTGYLNPGEELVEPILDSDPAEGEVYWLQSIMYIDDLIINGTDNVNVINYSDVVSLDVFTFYDQNASLLNDTTVRSNETFQGRGMYVRKAIDKSILTPGDIVEVEILISNFDNINKSVNVYDTVPQGFLLMEDTFTGTQEGQELSWEDIWISPLNTKYIRYELKYIDEENVGIGYMPEALITYEGQELYSFQVPFVRQYVPEKRIYVQKMIDYRDNDLAEVTVTVQNLGQGPLQDLILKEFLHTDDVFSELSVAPKNKGIWDLTEIKAGEAFVVSYVTDRNPSLQRMPEIYGVEADEIFKSLVTANYVESGWIFFKTKKVEIIGIIVIITLPFLYHGIVRYYKKKYGVE